MLLFLWYLWLNKFSSFIAHTESLNDKRHNYADVNTLSPG